jgi:hypothetical protein
MLATGESSPKGEHTNSRDELPEISGPLTTYFMNVTILIQRRFGGHTDRPETQT